MRNVIYVALLSCLTSCAVRKPVKPLPAVLAPEVPKKPAGPECTYDDGGYYETTPCFYRQNDAT